MSEKERQALEKISEALDTMSDYQRGRLVGYVERMEEEHDNKARAEQPAAEDSTNE